MSSEFGWMQVFNHEERCAIVNALREKLVDVEEHLRVDHADTHQTTTTPAMVAFNADPRVSALEKLDRGSYEQLRDYVEDYLNEFIAPKEKTILTVKKNHHGMNSVEVHRDSCAANLLRVTLLNNWMDSEAYKVSKAAGAFLQGFDEKDGWALVEFWYDDYQPFVDYINKLLEANPDEVLV